MRTQYENLRLVEPPPGLRCDTFPIIPYREGGLIERLPVLRSTHKGTLRSAVCARPLLASGSYDVVWTQALLPLLPLLVASDIGVRRWPAVVYTIDTTPVLMDGFTRIYYGTPPAGPAKRRARDALHRLLLRRCAAITPWSHWCARSFVRDYGVPSQRIHVIPPGVDLDAWSVPDRPRHETPGDHIRSFKLLFVGADFERKGGPLLLDVYRRHLRHRCELHLVTKARLDPQPGVRVYRDFRANDEGLRRLYGSCDALVLPTRADCFSLAGIEAMACGLPVISCAVGGIPEIVRHGETGLLVPPDDGHALLEALTMLLDDRNRAREMGLAGRRVAEERFDNRQSSGELLALLRRI